MFEREAVLYRFGLDYCRRQMQEVPDLQLTAQPAAGINTPAWILGHLAVGTDYALSLLRQQTRLPKSWHQHFGPGSKPDAVPGELANKAALLEALETGHEQVLAALPSADAAQLAAPHSVTFLGHVHIRTQEHLLAHLLTTHQFGHLGQLAMWRRLMGYPALF